MAKKNSKQQPVVGTTTEQELEANGTPMDAKTLNEGQPKDAAENFEDTVDFDEQDAKDVAQRVIANRPKLGAARTEKGFAGNSYNGTTDNANLFSVAKQATDDNDVDNTTPTTTPKPNQPVVTTTNNTESTTTGGTDEKTATTNSTNETNTQQTGTTNDANGTNDAQTETPSGSNGNDGNGGSTTTATETQTATQQPTTTQEPATTTVPNNNGLYTEEELNELERKADEGDRESAAKLEALQYPRREIRTMKSLNKDHDEVWQQDKKNGKWYKVSNWNNRTGVAYDFTDPKYEKEFANANAEAVDRAKEVQKDDNYRPGGVNNPTGTKTVTDAADDAVNNVQNDVRRIAAEKSYEDMKSILDEQHQRQLARFKDDEKRLRRERLMSGIGDVFNNMHRSYMHARGMAPMPGTEQRLSPKARERYERLMTQRDKIDTDYMNLLIKLQNSKTMAERYAALADYYQKSSGAKQTVATAKQKAIEKEEERKDQKAQNDAALTQAKVEETNAKAGKAEAQKKAIEKNGTASGNPPRQSKSGGSKSGGRQAAYNPNHDPNMKKVKGRENGREVWYWVPVDGGQQSAQGGGKKLPTPGNKQQPAQGTNKKKLPGK